MAFAIVCIAMIAALALVAMVANWLDKGEDVIETGHDCSTCTAADEGQCKIHCLIEEKKRKANSEE
ncbi:MAG: hypothetical protein IJ580_07380 [Prevotella sp.]|nr:hypothetical protein [Prevotella sp.]MBR1556748.1 hypothetical protein [Prevotella sp.]